MAVEEVMVPPVGRVKVRSSRRAKRMTLYVRASEVTVSLPPNASARHALSFIRQKSDWILKKQAEMRPLAAPIFTDGMLIGKLHTLRLVSSTRPRRVPRMTDSELMVEIQADANPRAEPAQVARIKRAVIDSLRWQALMLLPRRVGELADQFGFEYRNVYIKNISSRWGSCSPQKNINLNLRLIELPQPLIDYVILHELCHTVELNHSPRFWSLLKRVDSQALDHRKSLRDIQLYDLH